jgi:P4 family phage/plasmid primase-like protien
MTETPEPSAGAAPDPRQAAIEAAATKIDRAKAARSGAEGVASVLDGAREAISTADAAETASLPKSTEKPPTRGKGAHRLMAEIIAAVKLVSDKWGRVFRYQGGAWALMTDAQLDALAYRFDVTASPAKRNDVVKNLRVATIKEDLVWGRVANHEIGCKNGVLDVRTMKLREHSPEDYLERVLPVDWKPDARCEVLDQFLIDCFGDGDGDGGRTGALQKFFGYIGMSHARWKKALLLYSELHDTGKSVVALLAKRMVGQEYSCTLGVEHMDDPVKSAVLIGKALNVITEVSADAMIADGGFKTLVSTEEPILIDPKYKDPLLYVPAAKHVIVAQQLPRLNDHTHAVFSRLLIIPFDRQVPKEKQDRELLEKFNLEGVLVWLAAGARALAADGGQWPEVSAAKDVVQAYKDDINPIRQFMLERMTRYESILTPLAAVTVAFNRWNQGGRNMRVKDVGRLLRAAGYRGDIKVAKYEGNNITCLKGWRFAKEIDRDLYVKKATGVVDAAGVEEVEATDQQPQITAAQAAAAMELTESEGS